MKSSVKGIIGLLIIVILSNTTYFIWQQKKLKDIEDRQLIKPWNQLKLNSLIILGLWSDKPLKVIESNHTYFLNLSHHRNYFDTNDHKRYTGKNIKEILNSPHPSIEKKYFLDSLFYLGDKTMIKNIKKENNNTYILETNNLLENNIWWFHKKDQKGKLLILLENEIIGVYQLKGFSTGENLKLQKINKKLNLLD